MYVTDVWGVVYKIDVRSGTAGRILWKMDPGQQKPDRNRGVALWGNLVISVAGFDGRVIATDKESGQVVWDKKLGDQPDLEFTAAPLALKDTILIGASGGDNGVRDWLAGARSQDRRHQMEDLHGAGPRRARQRDLEGQEPKPGSTGGGALYVTGSYDPQTNLTYWGTGNPAPRYDSAYRPGDNLFTDSTVAFDAATGKMQWYFQYTANDNHDYDASRLADHHRRQGQRRGPQAPRPRQPQRLPLHARPPQRPVPQGRAICAKVTWTKGIDPKTGKPVDYDPSKDVQTYNHDWKGGTDMIKNSCPDVHGGTNFWPPSYSPKTKLLYIAGNEGCADITPDPTAHVRGKFGGGGYVNEARITSALVGGRSRLGRGEDAQGLALRRPRRRADHRRRHRRHRAARRHHRRATTTRRCEELWRINVGTGFVAPPMTYAVDGKQYIAIASGIGPVGQGQARALAGDEEPAQRHHAVRVRAVGPMVTTSVMPARAGIQ